MVHAISARFPFMGGESVVLYESSPMERYFPVTPGIEVSVGPLDEREWGQETGQESSTYNRRGQMSYPRRSGVLVDMLL